MRSHATPASVRVRAAAKVNLHLGVGAAREDGFHPLTTVYQAIGLFDDVTVERSDVDRLELHGESWVETSSIPLDATNLAARAAALLSAHHGRPLPSSVSIRKAIPVAGGLAGGSADGAATLVGIDRAWGLETPDEVLLEMAADLGSDVPFALIGGTALGTGRGELVDPIADEATWWWVAVPNRVGLSTPQVYGHFDRLFPDADPVPPSADALIEAVVSGEPVRLARTLHNDLQAPAVDLRPELGELIDQGEAAGALRGLISGSGPTVVFLCDGADGAREVAAELGGAGHDVVLVANGPVAGAHVVHGLAGLGEGGVDG
ncbi:4-(cytidine 5'-diphospho)-2-C-methyl-D-erythritol kinase [Nocardioides sp. R-C-SC26]|uniref:4-(cytidine 5'-diphospho)-2-C-methyl-D-erythritol kinase n=1 Tax=Nocardioides sp. R-C-SC26 TaxID=2870414 RepID=UPI001E5409DD|nr:4-(cytidine 5'-diphospho)-2-C-methyl-D-erythritol kinase [Nocardioides sp. R-C-SC26]